MQRHLAQQKLDEEAYQARPTGEKIIGYVEGLAVLAGVVGVWTLLFSIGNKKRRDAGRRADADEPGSPRPPL